MRCDMSTIVCETEPTVRIPVKEYKELLDKAARLDAISESIRQKVNEGETSSYSKVDVSVVLLLTGTYDYKKPVEPKKPQEPAPEEPADQEQAKPET